MRGSSQVCLPTCRAPPNLMSDDQSRTRQTNRHRSTNFTSSAIDASASAKRLRDLRLSSSSCSPLSTQVAEYCALCSPVSSIVGKYRVKTETQAAGIHLMHDPWTVNSTSIAIHFRFSRSSLDIGSLPKSGKPQLIKAEPPL